MKIENLVRVLAGSMTLLSVALVYFVSPWWLLLTCFVGLNLIQSAFTGFCPPPYAPDSPATYPSRISPLPKSFTRAIARPPRRSLP